MKTNLIKFCIYISVLTSLLYMSIAGWHNEWNNSDQALFLIDFAIMFLIIYYNTIGSTEKKRVIEPKKLDGGGRWIKIED